MTITPSEIWNNILKGNVEKDDPLWKEYLDKAAVVDTRMADELNKIVDVLLVYVALFIGVLTSFIIQTSTQFQRNPADITNDLLVAIYNQLAAQSNNTSIPPVDTNSYFHQSKDDYDYAVIQNALLYTSLSLSVIVSVIALVAKLWLVSYSHQTSSVGSFYERAMKRQEAYNGVLVWNLGGLINMLPVILLIALYLFGIYASLSVQSFIIGLFIGAFINVGAMFLGFSSLGGAFIPGCPFRSAFSGVLQFFIGKPIKWIRYFSRKWLRWLWIGICIISSAVVAYYVIAMTTGIALSLLFFPIAIPVAYSALWEGVHRSQKYKISYFALWFFLFVSLSTILAITIGVIFLPLLAIGALGIVFACWMIGKLSKSMVDTGEIDAITWLLITAPPQDPATFFKKAGQMTGLDSIGRHYRPRLLESLMPLLTLLITSYHAPEHHSSDIHSPSSSLSFGEDPHLKNLEIYTACLARLSEFTDNKGTFSCLWEDARQHPKLERVVIDKLVVFANTRQGSQVGLRSAATKILNNYELDTEGKSMRRSVGTALKSAASLLSNVNLNSHEDSEQRHLDFYRPVELATRVEPHSSEEIELGIRVIGSILAFEDTTNTHTYLTRLRLIHMLIPLYSLFI